MLIWLTIREPKFVRRRRVVAGELPPPEGGSFLHHRPTMPPQPQGWEGRCWAELNRRHTRRVAPTLTDSSLYAFWNHSNFHFTTL